MIRRLSPAFVAVEVVFLALSFGIYAGAKEPDPQIVNIGARKTVSLDGDWKFIADPYRIGFVSYHQVPLLDAKTFFADKDFYDDRTRLVEYSFSHASALKVPGDWNTQYEKLYYYEGLVWYRRIFDFTPVKGKRYFLYFGAVNYESEVALNGKRLCRHEGGFTPFNIEITEALNEGRNSLVVSVDNTRRKDGIPTDNSDWWNYGGITRSVCIVELPESFVCNYSLLLDSKVLGKATRRKPELHRIFGSVHLEGAAPGTAVNVRIPELGVSVNAFSDMEGDASFEINSRPVLWSPDSPKLYDVEISAGEDVVRDRIGFRYVETSGNRIMLNGKPVFCKGISVHEETIGTSRRVTDASECMELLSYVRELGCNFVRLAHYPHNEQMVRAAEELGLMVWSEIPAYWTISWDNKATYANAQRQLEDMILRDINRCNVVIWSVANETPVSDARTLFLSRLIARVRELDPTRLVSAAMEKTKVAANTYTVDDPLVEYTDLISFNQYLGWYSSNNADCDLTSWTFNSDKPVFISEFGAGAVYGNHGDADERFTEEYMADCFRRNLDMMTKRMPGLAGMTPWVLKDFRSPRRLLSGIQDDFNRKGVISENGERKQAFFVLKDFYASSLLGQIGLLPHNY